jgi:hypothetical protein
MGSYRSKQGATFLFATMMSAFLIANPVRSLAQSMGNSLPGTQQAAGVLTGDQQSAANSALCSALGSHFPNPTAAGPSALNDPGVLSTAAKLCSSSTSLPLQTAMDMLKDMSRNTRPTSWGHARPAMRPAV